jgi:hypothetical protein
MSAEPEVEYADWPRTSPEAVRSLARYLDTTETRAADLLADPAAYRAEVRSRGRISGMEARRMTERRYVPPATS